MTTEQIRINLVGVTRKSNSLLLSDRLGSSDITYYSSFTENDFLRFRTSCAGDSCETDIAGEDISTSVADFVADFTHPDFLEYQPVMRHNDIPLVQARGRIEVDGDPISIFAYGGWMENNAFAVMGNIFTEGDLEDAGSLESFSIGNATGTNPTKGSGTWKGSMVGVDVSNSSTRGNNIQGDATITIDDFLNPAVDVLFSNIFDLWDETSRNNMSWRNLSLTNGSFGEGSGENQINGKFYGPNHEEVGGVFERNRIVGSFGAKR